MAVHVAIYETDRAYGGPEEGGWFFDTGVPSEEYAKYCKFFDHRKAADCVAYMEELKVLVERVNREENRAKPYSVNNAGRYLEVFCFYGYPATFPGAWPRYE